VAWAYKLPQYNSRSRALFPWLGNYLFYDRQQMATGAATEDDCAGLVLARVVSHYPDRNRVIVDAGSLALSKDTAPQVR
jgi:D-serine deaminase-like pyridoxal phosphate-dependent protein